MGVRIIEGDGIAALYDSTAGYAFGPIADGDDPAGRLEFFQRWAEMIEGVDIRRLSHDHLMWLWAIFAGIGDTLMATAERIETETAGVLEGGTVRLAAVPNE